MEGFGSVRIQAQRVTEVRNKSLFRCEKKKPFPSMYLRKRTCAHKPGICTAYAPPASWHQGRITVVRNASAIDRYMY